MITHDEQFVESLAQHDLVDEFQRITRDPNGLSIIRREQITVLREQWFGFPIEIYYTELEITFLLN